MCCVGPFIVLDKYSPAHEGVQGHLLGAQAYAQAGHVSLEAAAKGRWMIFRGQRVFGPSST